MTDFLNFLNTADADTLEAMPSVTRAVAENIIAARPFETIDDCLKVNGMKKKLLTQMQNQFEAGENSDERLMLAVKEEARPVSVEKNPRVNESAQPSFSSRMRKAFAAFLSALLNLIATLAVLGSIGAAIYYGLPYVNRTVIKPLNQNTANVNKLKKEIVALQTQLDAANLRMTLIETTISAQSARIAKMEEMQTALEKESAAQSNSVMIALKREVAFIRAIETLARARLYLSQSNFGLAKQDVQSSRDILATLSADAPAYQTDAFKQIIARLDMALGNLPAYPVIAVSDADIAWQLMMAGLPESAAAVAATTTMTATPTLTSTPTPIIDATATP